MKKVLVKVKGIQGVDGEKNVIELSAEGILRAVDGEYIITYFEEQTVEGSQTKTHLTVKDDKTVILERKGAINSKLVITEGERNQCFYAIPQGSMTIGIYGKKIRNDMTEHGGTVKMIYTIDANLQPISENEVEILVEER